jgi:alpha-amylase/alpha-mannosidase (GH57 family)
MHQPFYRQTSDGRYDMPWVRLHAVKDYLHIAHVIADYPSIRQTINVVPSLGQQILEYAAGTALDRVLELSWRLAQPDASLTEGERREVLDSFFSINWDHFVLPVPRYSQLARMRELAGGDHNLFSTQYFVDLAVWYNLAWIDPGERSRDPVLRALVEKGAGFDRSDLATVLDKHREICAAIVPTYQTLARRNQVEVTTSPYFHPILPLLIDSQSARESSPDLPLPQVRFRYPADAARQIDDAIAFHQKTFGESPRGLWPPEGAISQAAISLIGAFPGIGWVASDEHVLARSLGRSFDRDEYGHIRQPEVLYRPYVIDGGPAIFFRDLILSDRVGFVYQHWNSLDAANDLVERLLQVQRALDSTGPRKLPPIVSIVLDGENCWETYPNNGDDFLRSLFARLGREPSLITVTPSQYLALEPSLRERLERLPCLRAASWISGNLETWIGEPDQNRAWEYLTATRRHFEAWETYHGLEFSAARARAHHALHVAEGSDWFWWYYSHNRVSGIDGFDRHFRDELATVFREMGHSVPGWLDRPIFDRDTARSRHMLGSISPLPLTAQLEAGPEWAEAAFVDLDQSTGAMQVGSRPLRRLYCGYDASNLYVRVETGPDVAPGTVGIFIRERDGARVWRARATGDSDCPFEIVDRRGSGEWSAENAPAHTAIGARAVELALAWSTVGLSRGTPLEVTAEIIRREDLDGLPTGDVAIAFTLGELLADEQSPELAEGVPHA